MNLSNQHLSLTQFQIEIIYVLLILPALYAESVDYYQYRYYTKFIPTLYLNILCFIKVNKVDDNYTHLSAIGLVCSLLGEIFWTFENEVFLTVGMLEYIISHLFIASAAVLNICSEKSIYKRSFSQNMYLGIISTLLWIISYLVASCYVIELILINFFSIKDSLLHQIIYFILITFHQSLWLTACYSDTIRPLKRVIVKIIFILTLQDQGALGAVFYFLGDISFGIKSFFIKQSWILNLIYISFHYYGQLFLTLGMFNHIEWYFERNQKRKAIQKQIENEKWSRKLKEKQEHQRLFKQKKLSTQYRDEKQIHKAKSSKIYPSPNQI